MIDKRTLIGENKILIDEIKNKMAVIAHLYPEARHDLQKEYLKAMAGSLVSMGNFQVDGDISSMVGVIGNLLLLRSLNNKLTCLENNLRAGLNYDEAKIKCGMDIKSTYKNIVLLGGFIVGLFVLDYFMRDK